MALVDLAVELSWGSWFVDAADTLAAVVLGPQVGEFGMRCRCACCILMRLKAEFRKMGVAWKTTFWEGKKSRNGEQGDAREMEKVW